MDREREREELVEGEELVGRQRESSTRDWRSALTKGLEDGTAGVGRLMAHLHDMSPGKVVLLASLLLAVSFYLGTLWTKGGEGGGSGWQQRSGQQEDLSSSWLPNTIGLAKRPDTLLGTPDKVMNVCPVSFSDYVPCYDPAYTQSLNVTGNVTAEGAFERHCEGAETRPFCLVPPPAGYRVPVRWPESRDHVYLANVNHTKLVREKGGQNWLRVNGSWVDFPGGGTQFKRGAAEYIQRIGDAVTQQLGDLNTAGILQVLDVGCGVASFGASLLDMGIHTMSFAKVDNYENQIQFALERGLPAMIAFLGGSRLPYPSRAFEMVHCSRCRVAWHEKDGAYLMEVDRLLRIGGFFVYSAPPVYNSRRPFKGQWDFMVNLADYMCWKLVSQDARTAVWRKTAGKKCQLRMKTYKYITVCEDNDMDKAWNVPLQKCVYPLEDASEVERLPRQPDRLHYFPRRMGKVSDKYTEEKYKEDSALWEKHVEFYWKVMGVDDSAIRNVMDMNAILGGFAAALVEKPLWVMNVVPVGMKNTLPVIYDRGLLGVAHDWAEPFGTYPRTYDLIHSYRLISTLLKKSGKVGNQIVDLMLEMDRILRPKGWVIIRDSSAYVQQVAELAPKFLWKADIHHIYVGGEVDDHELILVCQKQFWVIQ